MARTSAKPTNQCLLTLLGQQFIEFPLLIVVEDSQDSGLPVAQHIPVIRTEIVEDKAHLLRLFGSEIEFLFPMLERDLLASLGPEWHRPMQPLVGAEVHSDCPGYHARQEDKRDRHKTR